MIRGMKNHSSCRLGSVGRSFPHFETTILDPDDRGVGEILTRGRQVRHR